MTLKLTITKVPRKNKYGTFMDKVRACILLLLLAITIPVLISALVSGSPKPVKKHEFTVKCKNKKCKHEEVMFIEKIETARCVKCKGKVGYLWYCFSCYKSFAHIPRRISEKMSKRDMMEANSDDLCPFCQSNNIDYIGAGEYRRVNGGASKKKSDKKADNKKAN